MSKEIEIARLLNVRVDTNTGKVFLEMEVTDPVWRQRILREWQEVGVKLVIEEKKQNLSETLAKDLSDSEVLTEEDFQRIKKQTTNWGPK